MLGPARGGGHAMAGPARCRGGAGPARGSGSWPASFRSGVPRSLRRHFGRRRRVGFQGLQRHCWLSGTPRNGLPGARWSWSARFHGDVALFGIVPDVAAWVSGVEV